MRKEKHPSIPYNPSIASVLFRAGHIESWGRGTILILKECAQNNLPEPTFRYDLTGVWLEFTVKKTEIKPITGEVTGEVKLLILALSGKMKRSEIQKVLKLKHEDHFREKYLVPAINENVVEMTIPDKPRSRNQQYRLTQKGLRLKKLIQ